jgi:hypothetical protein
MSRNIWELYNDTPGFDAAEADLNAALAAVEEAARKAAGEIQKARTAAMAALNRHADVGACDSEPQYHMQRRMRDACRKYLGSFV